MDAKRRRHSEDPAVGHRAPGPRGWFPARPRRKGSTTTCSLLRLG